MFYKRNGQRRNTRTDRHELQTTNDRQMNRCAKIVTEHVAHIFPLGRDKIEILQNAFMWKFTALV